MNAEPMPMQPEAMPPVPPPPAALGPTLRGLRQARQATLSEVSVRLKFSVRLLQALEDEDWVHLPSGLALRGMVKNYARFLEADAPALLAMLDAQAGTRAGPMHVATPMSLGDADASYYARHGKPWIWMVLIAAVLVVTVVYAIERDWIAASWFDWLRG